MNYSYNAGVNNPNYGRMASLSFNWRGDEAGIVAIHFRIKNLLPKPDRCDRCHKVKSLDLSNKDHKYSMNLKDWEWLCRSCHMKLDGRMSNLIQNTPEKYSDAANKGWETRKLNGWIHPFKNKWRYRQRDSKGRFL